MSRHIISLLVENHAGVLSRIAGLFSRRGYNIDSLSVGETEDKRISRMTITVTGDEHMLEQIKKQLNKLVNTIKIIDLSPEKSILRELILIKLKADLNSRTSIIEIANIFNAKVVDVSQTAITLELTGSDEKVQNFLSLLSSFEIIEFIRSGATGISKG
jgi:acetolactate synthase-1/3 small subunit